MSTRFERIQQLINEGNVEKLWAKVSPGPCACLGPHDNEPLCVCRMTIKQIRDQVSYAALQRGKLVRLKNAKTELTNPNKYRRI